MIAWFFASHLVSTFTGGGLLKLFLGNLMGDLRAVVRFLKAHSIWLTISIALCLCWGVDHVISHRHAHKLEVQLGKAVAGREADRRAYAKAQTDAAVQNKAHVAKVEQQYQRNSDNERQSYLDDLARLRRMRGQGSTAQGAASGAGSPAPHSPATGADGTDKLPLPPEELLRAQEIELQLMHLQSWVEQQLAVDPNK